DGKWSRTKIGSGAPGEVKLGKLSKKVRALATVEPWHGNSVVVYREASGKGKEWTREVLDDTLTGGHALGWADFDGDGVDDVVAGWRDKQYGLALYRWAGGKWNKEPIETGAMAAEDLAVGDLNGDGRPDVVAAGRASSNVKIYWNDGKK
ncbi:MAG: VCBS repeat-containing protein, partial [Acidobacteria bacterium]|nr:VCBS repeat-containing protein [Acidobacteriota bacterium]